MSQKKSETQSRPSGAADEMTAGGDKTARKTRPHHSGHRDRLRQRFIQNGAQALADYELLELILFMAIPRKDVKPLAKDLISHFGGFGGVMHAGIRELAAFPGLSENSACALKSVQAAAFHLMRAEVINKPVLNSWTRLMEYCKATMAHEKRENFRILFLNKKNELIADEVQQHGTVDHTPAYPREIMKRALEVGATAMILVHNHPSGDSTPSKEDIAMTKNIIEAAKPFNIVIHDHVIVARKNCASMRNLGLM